MFRTYGGKVVSDRVSLEILERYFAIAV